MNAIYLSSQQRIIKHFVLTANLVPVKSLEDIPVINNYNDKQTCRNYLLTFSYTIKSIVMDLRQEYNNWQPDI